MPRAIWICPTNPSFGLDPTMHRTFAWATWKQANTQILFLRWLCDTCVKFTRLLSVSAHVCPKCLLQCVSTSILPPCPAHTTHSGWENYVPKLWGGRDCNVYIDLKGSYPSTLGAPKKTNRHVLCWWGQSATTILLIWIFPFLSHPPLLSLPHLGHLVGVLRKYQGQVRGTESRRQTTWWP